MRQSALSLPITFPWLFGIKLDLFLFFLPALFGTILMSIAQQGSIASSPILLTLFLQGFGIGPFHQGITWFHYFDANNREHYGSGNNKLWSVILPAVIVFLTTVLFWYYPLAVTFVYVLWTIQHIAQQNVGVMLLYHNHGRNEVIVDRNIEVRSIQTAAAFFSFLFLAHMIVGVDKYTYAAVYGVVAATALELLYLVGRYVDQIYKQVKTGKSLNVPSLCFWLLSLGTLAPLGIFARDYTQGLFAALVIHWFQYIGLNAILVRRKYGEESNKRALTGHRPIALFVSMGVFYAVLSMPLLTVLGNGFNVQALPWQIRLLAGIFNGLTLAHYFVDAFMWRFRDEFNRKSLLAYLKPSTRTPTVPAFVPIEQRELALH